MFPKLFCSLKGSSPIWKLPPNFIPPEGLRSLKEWMELEVQYPVVPLYGTVLFKVMKQLGLL